MHICFYTIKFKGLFVHTDSSSRHERFPDMLRPASRGFVCDVLCHFGSPLPATNETQSEQSEREQIVDQVVDDGAKIGDDKKRTLLHRQRKSAKNNAMVSLSEVQKRLKAIEER